ncbi:MarC family protein [Pseudoalteromonas sp. S2755]|uniref:MarC family protein n=1 Tax=Pseudoalteromonas sp. S2755 TaxID=2066523 RepID=UPI00110A0CCA|nr:MarC family protein [Pseudoalteromonas sp. S2755]TMN42544.1 MarC family transcriptional regulator [Pseudoalteromonas sp. S2755]
MEHFISTFIFFFAVIDPIGTIPVFIATTTGFDIATKRKIAVKATLVAAIVLLFFIIAGELILNAIGIPLPAFAIAGGIVLFIFAMTMIFGEGKPSEEMKLNSKASDTAIFPLAMPSIASPGAMLAAVLLTKNSENNVFEQLQTSMIMLSVLAIVLLFLLVATKIHQWIGDSGASIVSRVMGLVLASVAVSSVLAGIKEYFML